MKYEMLLIGCIALMKILSWINLLYNWLYTVIERSTTRFLIASKVATSGQGSLVGTENVLVSGAIVYWIIVIRGHWISWEGCADISSRVAELTTVHDLTGLTTGNFEIIVHRRQFRIMNNVLVIIITAPSFVRV